MKKLPLLILTLLIFNADGLAQESFDLPKWSIQVTQGPSLPFGKFKKSTGPQAFWVDQEGGGQRLIGFPKEGNGFAETGYQLEVSVRKKVGNKLGFNLSLSTQKNSLYKESMNSAWEYQNVGVKLDVKHDPYVLLTILPSIDYVLLKNNVNIHITSGYGIARLDYPYYFFEDPYNPGVYFGHTSKLDDVWSGMFHLGCQIGYKFSQSISITSQIDLGISDFEFDNLIGGFPGGATPSESKDKVNVRSLNIGFGFSYAFNSRKN